MASEVTNWHGSLTGEFHDNSHGYILIHPPLEDSTVTEILDGDVLTGPERVVAGVGLLEIKRGVDPSFAREEVIAVGRLPVVHTMGSQSFVGSSEYEIAEQFNLARQTAANRS